MVLLDSQILTDANIDFLAESMNVNGNTIIKEKSAEMPALMAKLVLKNN